MTKAEDMPEKVRELLRSGQLPARAPDRVWGGPGSGQDRCPICGDGLSPQQMAIEAEFDNAEGSKSLEFHGSCFRVVESEWSRFKPTSDSIDNGAALRLGPGSAR